MAEHVPSEQELTDDIYTLATNIKDAAALLAVDAPFGTPAVLREQYRSIAAFCEQLGLVLDALPD